MPAYFPQNTYASISLEKLIIRKKKLDLDDRMSSRMVKCAALLNREDFVGWQMIVPTKGISSITVFGSDDLSQEDLKWISEKIGKPGTTEAPAEPACEGLDQLYELVLPIHEGYHDISIGFGANLRLAGKEENLLTWPLGYISQFDELIRAFRNTGAWLRMTIGSADAEERNECKKELLRTWDPHSNISPQEYAGTPVRTRFLLRLPGKPSIRLRTVLAAALPGLKLKPLGNITEDDNRKAWDNPLEKAVVLPDYAARILIMEPYVREPLIGLETCEEGVKDIPASHTNTKEPGAITIGKARDVTGEKRDITVGINDLKRHVQIIGQTGTGKSTLLANTILSAITQGYSLTFFDPHGSTIDTILRCVSPEYKDKIRVVRIGDADNPVPLNLWDSTDPEKEEKNINDLCELFGDIFDPNKEGILGPRWERWFSTFAKASIAFYGNMASLESITVLSQNQDNMLKLYKTIIGQYPNLAAIIRDEYGKDKSSDFVNMINWCLSKFQRLTAVEQLRKTLGAGADALDFDRTIDSDQITLIDLASPVIGTHAARIIGTLLLMKLWNAALTRKDREKTHIIAIDEASLYQHLVPRILAESRKFGISMILSHQHTAQLRLDMREALEANTANFIAFRLSPKDASVASIRFDDPEMQVLLTRIDAFKAITTLSVDGRQTAPFTLEIDKPEEQKDGERIAKEIEEHSIRTLVKPYQHVRALTRDELVDLLNNPEKRAKPAAPKKKNDQEPQKGSAAAADTDEAQPSWLEKWMEKRNTVLTEDQKGDPLE